MLWVQWWIRVYLIVKKKKKNPHPHIPPAAASDDTQSRCHLWRQRRHEHQQGFIINVQASLGKAHCGSLKKRYGIHDICVPSLNSDSVTASGDGARPDVPVTQCTWNYPRRCDACSNSGPILVTCHWVRHADAPSPCSWRKTQTLSWHQHGYDKRDLALREERPATPWTKRIRTCVYWISFSDGPAFCELWCERVFGPIRESKDKRNWRFTGKIPTKNNNNKN